MVQGRLFTKRKYVRGGEDEKGEGDEEGTKSAPTCIELRSYQIRNVSMSPCVHMSKRAEQRREGSNLKGNRVQS